MSAPTMVDTRTVLRDLIQPGALLEVLRSEAPAIDWLGPGLSEVTIDRITGAADHYYLHVTAGAGPAVSRRLMVEIRSDDVARAASEIQGRLRKENRRQLGSGEVGMVAVGAYGLLIRRAGLDERIPCLGMLRRPRRARPLVEEQLGSPVTEVELLGHRLHKRAVLRVTTGSGSVVVKAYKRRSQVPARVVGFMHEAAEFGRGRLGPRLLAHHPGWAALVLEDVPAVGGGEFDRLTPDRIEPVAAALRSFHRQPVGGVPVHGVGDEVSVLAAAARLAADAHPCLRPLIGAAQARVARRLAGTARVTGAAVHRDAHPGQFTAEAEPRLLDLDTISVGDPMLDLGNLAAYLRLSSGREATAALIEAYRPEGPDRRRLTGWTVGASLRLALIRLPLPHTHLAAAAELERLAG